MIHVEVTREPLPPFEAQPPRPDAGAEIVFHGRVRASEKDRAIVALHYEQYEAMARRELEALARACIERFALLDLACVHRVGDVVVGEPSLRVVIRSRHRGEGIEGLDWFIRALKATVPIWKWGVTRDGERYPSG